jgi:hypothetical protein
VNKPGLLKLIASSALPEALKSYLGGVISLNLPSSLRETLKKDPDGFVKGVCGLLREAGAALGCAGDKALFLSGFDGNNLAPDRLEAALAEMLAVVFLKSEGFCGINFISRGTGRTADLSAARGGAAYAFEVCSARAPGDALSVDFLELKYDKKIRQAKISGKKGGLDRAGLVLVAGPLSFAGLESDERLAGLASGLYERKNKPRATHICLLSCGRAAVFPPW